MIIVTDLQLGARDQTVYKIDKMTNELLNGSYPVSKAEVLGRFPVNEVGEALCNFYFGLDVEKIVISGPEAIGRAVEEDIYETAKRSYRNQNIKVELI